MRIVIKEHAACASIMHTPKKERNFALERQKKYTERVCKKREEVLRDSNADKLTVTDTLLSKQLWNLPFSIDSCENTWRNIGYLSKKWRKVDPKFLRTQSIPLLFKESKTSLLHKAINDDSLEYVKKLIKSGVDVNSTNKKGESALELAITKGSINIVKYLIRRGADINVKGPLGITPLHRAMDKDRFEIALYLINHGADVNATDKDGTTPLHKAAAVKKSHWHLEYLIEKQANINAADKNGTTPLHIASLKGNYETVKYLVEKGADIQTTNQGGDAPIHLAALKGDYETVKHLVEKGADIHAANQYEDAPIHLAALKGDYETVKYLVEKGADIHATNQDGNTPIHLATYHRHYDSVKYLVEKGADIHATNQDGNTPIHLAAYQGDYDSVKYLVEKDADIHATNQDGNTPIHLAALKGDYETVKYLVEKGADINATNQDGNTPIHLATYHRYYDSVKYLVEKGADIHATNQDGNTPLHLATYQRYYDSVKYLVEKGADIRATNQDGESSPFLALRGELACVKYLTKDKSIRKNTEKQLLFDFTSGFSGITNNNMYLQDKTYKPSLRKRFIPRWFNSCRSVGNGSRADLNLPITIQALQDFFVKEGINDSLDINSQEEILKVMRTATLKDPSKYHHLLERIHQGKTTAFTAGWHGHAIGLVFHNDRLFIMNIGEGSSKHPILVYTINPKQLDEETLKKIHEILPENQGESFFYGELLTSLNAELDNKLTYLFDDIKSQKINNCYTVASKLMVRVLLFLAIQKTHSKEGIWQAYFTAKKLYKRWTKRTRIESLKHYRKKYPDMNPYWIKMISKKLQKKYALPLKA